MKKIIKRNRRFKARIRKGGSTKITSTNANENHERNGTDSPVAAKGKRAKERFGHTLPGCQTGPEVKAWLAATHQGFGKKALKAVARRNIPDQSRIVLEGLLSKPEATSSGIMTSPRLVTDLFDHLRNALVDLSLSDPPIEMALVTLIAGDCETSSDRPVVEHYASRKRAKSTLRAMSPNYIGITELAMFNTIRHPDGGYMCNHHDHAIIFGNIQRATYAANKQRKKYPPNTTGAMPIHVKPIRDVSEENLARVAAYLLKAPLKMINFVPPMNGKKGFLNKSEKGDRMIRYLRMAQLRSMLTFEDCCYAGGQGLEIRKKLVDLMRALAVSDASPSQRLLHPDAIPTFWVDLAKELGRDQWALPIIKRRS